MTYPKKPARKILAFIFAVCCLPSIVFSQADSSYFLNSGVKIGSSLPLGSMSKNSSQVNAFGKYYYAFNAEIFTEYIFKKHFSVSLAYRFLDYAVRNDNAATAAIQQKFGSVYSSSLNFDESALSGGFVSIGFSGIIQYQRLRLQAKLAMAMGALDYDYSNMQTQADTTPHYYRTTTYLYSCKPVPVITLIPEINLQYIFLKKRSLDFALFLNASYFRLKPKFTLTEFRDAYGQNDQTTNFMTLEDRITMLNLNLGFSIYIKRYFRKN